VWRVCALNALTMRHWSGKVAEGARARPHGEAHCTVQPVLRDMIWGACRVNVHACSRVTRNKAGGAKFVAVATVSHACATRSLQQAALKWRPAQQSSWG